MQAPVDGDTQAVLFNAVPLLILAALYLVVTAALLPSFIRERRRLRDVDVATALMFPCIGIAAAFFGVLILIEREPVEGHTYVFLIPIALAYVPAIVFLANWRQRREALTGTSRARQAEALSSARERELEAVGVLSRSLVTARDPDQIGRPLVEQTRDVLGIEFAALALVDESATTARFSQALRGNERLDWLVGTTLDLTAEPSGIASAVVTREAFAVADAQASTRVSRRLVEQTEVRGIAFVPLLTPDHVLGVLVAGSARQRVFSLEELEVLGALAAEAALALERLRSAEALEEALEREQLTSRVAADLRSELDLDRVLEVAVRALGDALGLSRSLIRVGGPVAAEWVADGLEPVGDRAPLLPVANLAEAHGATVAVADVEADERLDDAESEVLLALGSRAALSTPVRVHGEPIGVLSIHRASAGRWSHGAVALVEAVAREAGLAIHTARLLGENRRRLAEHAALLDASRTLTSELQFDAVIRRMVDEVSRLLGADAADCWTFEEVGRRLRCRAVRGLPETDVGRVIVPTGAFLRAIESGRPVHERRTEGTDDSPEIVSEARFAELIVAPIAAGGEVRGVLGVSSLEPDRFGDADLTLLEAFGRLAGVALQNAEAFADSERRARVQRGFFRIASVLGEPLSAQATLDAVAQAATEALGGDAAALLLSAGPTLELAGAHDLRPAFRAALAEGTTGAALRQAAEERRTLASSDLVRDDRFSDWRTAAEAAGACSLLAVPLEDARAHHDGLVVVLFSEERRFVDDDLELAAQVAVAARGALERSEAYETERRARVLAQHLAATGRALGGELDPGMVLDELARQVTALLDTPAASVRLLEGDELVVHAAVGEDAAAVLGARSASTARIAGDIVQSREPAAITGVREGDRHDDVDPLLAAGGYRSYLGVPLIGTEGDVHGVVAALDRRPRAWRPDEVEAFRALATNASAALSNAELYQRVALEKGQSEAILANVADGIVAVDRDGNVVLWNAAAERITGVPAAEAVGRTPEQALGRSLASDPAGATPPSPLVPIRKGAEDVWLSVTESVMTDPTGAVAGRIFTFRDISDERVVEEMKSEFVSAVSHELRSPLTSIYGFAETLLRDDVQFGEDEQRTFVRYIASESERLTTIVDMLLSVARLESGEVLLRLAPTDVGAVVAEAVQSVEATLGGNGHRFVTDIDDGPLDAEADREKLRQVLAILLDNAVRYSPSGGRVRVVARPVDEAVEVRVEDEGIGIPPAEQERIFRKFYRGEAGTRMVGTGNTGLGLFIAEGLVTAMGGRMWVNSREGEGSTFGFELPAPRTERSLAGVEHGGRAS
jgi:signal transduction histidine kinase